MIKLLIDIGVDINGGDCHEDLLGHAAAAGNTEIVRMFLEAGANSSLALRNLLISSDHLSDALFKRLLKMLVENARPASFSRIGDPLLTVTESSRALRFHPKAPEIPLNRHFTKGVFGKEANPVEIGWSYMYPAIIRRNISLVELLIRNGAYANVQMAHFFECPSLAKFTWITFSVMCGAGSCADILIQHGVDVTALDGAGWSAIQLAKRNALVSHPRKLKLWGTMSISDEKDAETLAVVQRAFNLKSQGSMGPEVYHESSNELTLQPLPQQHGPILVLRELLAKVLGIIFTLPQTKLLHDRLGNLCLGIREAWSLSFYEALLMRFIYALSYALLLGLEIHAFVTGHKRILMPSRVFLSAIALMLLALVWDSSQMGFSWGSITA